MQRPPRTPIAPLLSRRAIALLATEALLLCGLLPVARWLGATAAWLLWPWCVISLAMLGLTCTAPLLFAAHVRRAAAGRLLFCIGSAAIGMASLALTAVAYECLLRDTMCRLDRVVTAVESRRRTRGELPASLEKLFANADSGFAPHGRHRLFYRLLPDCELEAFELSMECPDERIVFLGFGTYLVYRSEWGGQRPKGFRRDLGLGWKLIEAD